MADTVIPGFGTLSLRYVILDYNGTIALDGVLKQEIKTLLHVMSEHYDVHVITADTFGSVARELDGFDITLKILSSSDHSSEKAAYISGIGAEYCVAIGNGNNDMPMLKTAALGIAVLGEEGCATPTLLASDIVCSSIQDALQLCLNEKRLIATLRK